MKKKILVKHTHRYTHVESVLFDGYADCNDFVEYLELSYKEADDIKVVMYCYHDRIVIERFGEVQSRLDLRRNTTTQCPMKSAYGTFDIEIKTYDYEKRDNTIVVAYDIENGSADKDGFKIAILIKEDRDEYN